MTLSTSLVAVCCSSASERSSVRWRSSLSSRVFSMAMTACAAKFVHQRDLLVGERADLLTKDRDSADQLVILEHRHNDQRTRAADETEPGSPAAATVEVGAKWTRSLVCKRRLERVAGFRQERAARFSVNSAYAGGVMSRDTAQTSRLRNEQHPELGFANARRVLEHGLEHRIELARRA